jgi:tetratricopeptide (TPR) repeat protein
VLLIAGWAGVRNAVHDAPGRFLLACTAGGCGFLLVVNPRLGMGRDWDLFALTAVGPMLLLVRAVAAQGSRIIRARSSLLILSLVLVAPFFSTNLSYGSSIEYFKWLLRLDAGRSRPGIVALRNYYRTTGNAAQADSLDRIMMERFPSVYLVPRAKALAVSGKYQEALALADSVFRIDPYAPEPYNLRGVIYLEMKAFDRAVADFRQAVAFAPYDHRLLVNLAIAYQGLGTYDPIMPILRRAQEISPKYPLLLECLAMMFTGMNRYDSVLVYAQALMQVDSLNDRAYLIAGGAAYALGDHALAKKYLTHYLALNPSGREASDAAAILKLLE